jgi:hypothetical protein
VFLKANVSLLRSCRPPRAFASRRKARDSVVLPKNHKIFVFGVNFALADGLKTFRIQSILWPNREKARTQDLKSAL